MRQGYIILLVASLALVSCKDGVKSAPQCPAGEIITLEYAEGFSIERCDSFTKVTVRDPWDTTKTRRTYLLVEKGMEVPASLPQGTLIRIPVEKAVIYASVHAAMASRIGSLDRVCGVCEPQYLTCPDVKQRVESGSIADLGLSTSPDIEKIVSLGADVIIASPFENSGFGAAEKLGVPIVEAADYMENHPLGRAEWIKFYGLLLGREAEADSIFNATRESYNALRTLAQGCLERPTVMLERKYGATWGVPGAESYIAVMHRDAGADYIFSDIPGTGSAQKSFEEVFDRACHANFWLMKHNRKSGLSYSDLRAEYSPYANFDAFKERRIFACNTVGTPYYDDIALSPDLILKDFISIYHPELLPGYTAKYYKPLTDK